MHKEPTDKLEYVFQGIFILPFFDLVTSILAAHMISNLKTAELTAEQEKTLNSEIEWLANTAWNACISAKDNYTTETAQYWNLTVELFGYLQPTLANTEKRVNRYIQSFQMII